MVQDLRDREQSIDQDLREAMTKIDIDRRERCKSSLVEFVNHYLVGNLFSYRPEGRYIDALEDM